MEQRELEFFNEADYDHEEYSYNPISRIVINKKVIDNITKFKVCVTYIRKDNILAREEIDCTNYYDVMDKFVSYCVGVNKPHIKQLRSFNVTFLTN